MRIICAWCNNEIESKQPLPNAEVTWGICRDCYARVDAEAESMHQAPAAPSPAPRAPDEPTSLRARRL